MGGWDGGNAVRRFCEGDERSADLHRFFPQLWEEPLGGVAAGPRDPPGAPTASGPWPATRLLASSARFNRSYAETQQQLKRTAGGGSHFLFKPAASHCECNERIALAEATKGLTSPTPACPPRQGVCPPQPRCLATPGYPQPVRPLPAVVSPAARTSCRLCAFVVCLPAAVLLPSSPLP